jgi:ketopantoate hydroxymethyltransferase
MFGLYPRFKPRMAKVFGDAGKVILDGLKAYAREVTEKTFPQPENFFGMPDEEYEELLRLLR